MTWPSPPHQVRKHGSTSPQATWATPPWIQSYYTWVGWWLDNMGYSAKFIVQSMIWWCCHLLHEGLDRVLPKTDDDDERLIVRLGGLIWYQVRHFKRNSLFLQPHSLINHNKATLYTLSHATLHFPRWERLHCLRRQELHKIRSAGVPVWSPACRLLGRRNSWEREVVVCVGRETECGNSWLW